MTKSTSARRSELTRRRRSPLITPTDLGTQASVDIAGSMNVMLADVFALYLKTKNFHWHMSGPHFRDYHLLLDEQADQIYAMTDPIAERIRKTGGSTLRSIGHIARMQRIIDNDAEYVDPLDMLAELRDDNLTLAARLREVHSVVDELRDIATASVVETWIDGPSGAYGSYSNPAGESTRSIHRPQILMITIAQRAYTINARDE